MTIEIRGRTSKASCGHIVKSGEKYMSIPTGTYMGRTENRTYCLAEGCGGEKIRRLSASIKAINKELKAKVEDKAETEDTRRCHLCDSIEENKWCVNTTCYEYTKHENLYPI